MSVNGEDDDDGVNESSGGGDFGLSALGRAEKQHSTRPANVRHLERRAQIAEEEELEHYDRVNSKPALVYDPKWKAKHDVILQQKKRIADQIGLSGAASSERLNTQLVNAIGRDYSERAIGSYVRKESNSLGMQVAGGAAAQQGYSRLMETRGNIVEQMSGLRQESMNIARSAIGPDGMGQDARANLEFNARLMKDLGQKLTPIDIGLSQLKRQGLDPDGQMRSLVGTTDKAAGLLAYNKIEDEMKSGKGMGALSAVELKKKESEAAEKLIKAMDALHSAVGATSDEMKILNKNAEEAAKDFEDTRDARKIGPPGSGDSGYKQGAAWGSIVANVASLVGNTIQTMAIDQPMAVMGNIAGYANLENQKYDMWTRGMEGNMTDRLNSRGWENAKAFGQSMATRAGVVVGSRIVGGAAATVAGGLQTFDAATSVEAGTLTSKLGLHDANTIQTLGSGIQATGEGIAMTAISGKDALQKISTSRAEIAANLQAMSVTKELNHVTGYQMQQFRDYQMGLMGAGAELGGGLGEESRASKFLDKAGGADFMGRMKGVGVGTMEFAQLAHYGATNMGSTFDADMVLRAKRNENMGWGTAQENMQRMTGFATAGSQNPQQSFEKVMERAVGSGINSSKALGIIAENTAQMVQQDNMKGAQADTSESLAKLILGAIAPGAHNQEFAVQAATEAYKGEEQWRTNTSTSFAGRIAVGRLQKDLDLDYGSALKLGGIDSSVLAEWQDRMEKDPANRDAILKEAFSKGIDLSKSKLWNKDAKGFLETANQDKTINEVEAGGTGFGWGATGKFAGLKKWIEEDPKDSATRQLREQMFMGVRGKDGRLHESDLLQDPSTPQSVRDAMLALARTKTLDERRAMGVNLHYSAAGDAVLPDDFAQRKDFYGEGVREKSRGARNQVDAAYEGGKTITGDADFKGGKGITGTAVTGDIHQASAGPEAQARFAEAAANAAHDFGASAHALNEASGKLDRAAQKLLDWSGGSKLDKIEDVQKDIAKLQTTIDALPKGNDDKKPVSGN
jgi:hypothetical protein